MPIPLLLHGRHADSAAYEFFGPWIVPWHFGAWEEEYRCLRQNAGLIDYSTQALIEVRGKDRVDFLQRLLTNDIQRLKPQQGCNAALLTSSGKLISVVMALADPQALWLLCDLQSSETLLSVLNRYLFTENVELIAHERRQAVLALQGPESFQVLSHLLGTSVDLTESESHCFIASENISMRLIRHSLTGDKGLLCLVSAPEALTVWEYFLRAGSQRGLKAVGWQALQCARIEAGIPWFGKDMDEETILSETGLEKSLVSETKGCYVGQEIVARIGTYGSPSKKLMGLKLQTELVPDSKARILREGKEVGFITSSCYSPKLGGTIAMGYLNRESYTPQTSVQIEHAEKYLSATVVALPFS
ncbi:MAG: aminomethyl transferase family protein [Candidatus Omnitrophica bacterium]|nr:aminomethyl transferase family protein [Candidatus Omnitrophota bacterium]